MAEAMTVELIIDAYWSLKGYKSGTGSALDIGQN